MAEESLPQSDSEELEAISGFDDNLCACRALADAGDFDGEMGKG